MPVRRIVATLPVARGNGAQGRMIVTGRRMPKAAIPRTSCASNRMIFTEMDASLPKHQRIVIALSVHVLRSGVTRCGEARVDTIEIRLALRCLLPHCRERWPLELYWDAARQENEIGRAQGVTAAFNGIVRQLRLAGRYDETASS